MDANTRTPPTDKELTNRITVDLLDLPDEIRQMEAQAASLRVELQAASQAVKDAELEAELNCNADGKNAETRKRQLETAVRDDVAAQVARAKVAELEAAIAAAEVDTKGLTRRYAAALALSELQSAKINFLARASKPNGADARAEVR